MNKLIYTFILVIVMFSSCQKEEEPLELITLMGGEPHTFENKANSPDRYNFVWDFGDGSTSTDITPTHTYFSAGYFFVTVSIYNKNGTFISSQKYYRVKVEKLYRPDVHQVDVYTEDYNYLYVNKEVNLDFKLTKEQEKEDYTFKVVVDNNTEYTDKYNKHTFSISGSHNVKFILTDKNGVSGILDTNINVGAETSKINIKVPNTYASQLGTIKEQYIIFVNVAYSYNNFNDIMADISFYPNTSNPFLKLVSGEWESYHYYSSLNSYGYGSVWFQALHVHVIPKISNNTYEQALVPAFEASSTRDYDEMEAIVLLIGTNGKAYGNTKLNLTPGLESSHTVQLNFHNY